MEEFILKTLTTVGAFLEEHNYPYEIKEKNNQFTLSIQETMRDSGFAAGNSVLELFFEKEMKILFIGLLRLPPSIRKKKLGEKIVTLFKTLAIENGLTLMADANDGREMFWMKQEFGIVLQDCSLFYILAFSLHPKEYIKKWDEFKETKMYKEFFSYHG